MAEASIDLVVMVAPNKPKGPMRIDDVNAEVRIHKKKNNFYFVFLELCGLLEPAGG